MDRPTLTRILKPLLKPNSAERKPGIERHRCEVTLTGNGSVVLAKASPLRKQINKNLLPTWEMKESASYCINCGIVQGSIGKQNQSIVNRLALRYSCTIL